MKEELDRLKNKMEYEEFDAAAAAVGKYASLPYDSGAIENSTAYDQQ